MELKSRITELLNSELEILAYEQKKLNEYKLTPEPSQKAIETRQRIISQRLELYNELNDLFIKVDNFINKIIYKLQFEGSQGHYLPDQYKIYINQGLTAKYKNLLAEAEANYQAAKAGSLKEKLAEIDICFYKSFLRTAPFRDVKPPISEQTVDLTKLSINEALRVIEKDIMAHESATVPHFLIYN